MFRILMRDIERSVLSLAIEALARARPTGYPVFTGQRDDLCFPLHAEAHKHQPKRPQVKGQPPRYLLAPRRN